MAALERWQGPRISSNLLFTTLLLIFASCIKVSEGLSTSPFSSPTCPEIRQVFEGFIPSDRLEAGKYDRLDKIDNLDDCIYSCCNNKDCNVVFMHVSKPDNATCFNIACNSFKSCMPTTYDSNSREQMILVRSLPNDEDGYKSWSEFIQDVQLHNKQLLGSEPVMQASESEDVPYPSPQDCEVGVNACPNNEECVPVSRRSRNGVCTCEKHFVRRQSGDCKAEVTAETSLPKSEVHPIKPVDSGQIYVEGGPIPVKPSEKLDPTHSSPLPPLRHIDVTVVSKTVTLPENEVALSAYTVPSEKPDEPYTYEWSLISKPEGEGNTGTMNDQNSPKLKLSHLGEGLYTFKVSVTSKVAYGETLVNVTVLPAKRINKEPTAVITPVSQIVKSPNTGAVLDGSTSTDDDEIVKWHWELQQGPLVYTPHLEDTRTLELHDLTHPGNYTFKLTVTDSDGATDSTTANITVVMGQDYPPEANAGQDIIVYLPQNNVTLNGSLSSDDHGIAFWEWTKVSSDQNKAVDMQYTRTPYLRLSNLEEGMYTFSLKVTDTSNQSSLAVVHVFVKPPTNKPPPVDAGSNITISLPQNWVTLNGSNANSDLKISSWTWEELKRPPGSNPVVFSSPTDPVTNATDLTKGDYEFQLTAVDSTGNKGADSVFVTVTQNKNTPPKADAGADQTVVLPVSVVKIDGSQSTDDLAIVHWEWTREPNSLALGKIVGQSDSSPVLMLTDVVPGRYVFRLKVTDEQGASSEDTVSINVKPDPHRYDLVELTLNIEGDALTKSQEDSLRLKLSLLLKDHSIIHIHQLRQEPSSGRAQIVFYVGDKTGKSIMAGTTVVQQLKRKLEQDIGLLELPVANIQTEICQNNCSGHGVCDKASRLCFCEAFWMQNVIRKYFGDKESNCDWSILYVVIGLFSGVILFVGGLWGIICLCQRAFARRIPRTRKRYAPLDSGEEDSMIPKYFQDKIFTDTDSDSDVVFESHGKTNGDIHNGLYNKNIKNGVKSGRRIKT